MSGAPDLATSEGRQAYMKELGQVARGWRYGGIITALAGVGVLVSLRFGWLAEHPMLQPAGMGLLVGGAALMIMGIVIRTRYHLKRMKQTGGS